MIMVKNFPELKEDINFQIEEAHQVLNRMNTGYITVNCKIPKIKNKEEKINCREWNITDCKLFIGNNGGQKAIE